ncbi:alpha/beta hydrolase (plasmid) [Coraliomargarita sp. W4R53]
MNTAQRLLRAASVGTPGLRRVRRPAHAQTPEFELAYARTGPRTHSPTVIIPGGPGLGSILPYRQLRRWAAQGGLDVIMVEHRGIGLSRLDTSGRDLPQSAMRITDVIDDIASVLDHEGVSTAFIAGSSYGSYLASSFGVRHRDRVAGMLLDSALQTTEDLGLERIVIRELFWHGDEFVPTAVRRLIASGEDEQKLMTILRAAYELGGNTLVEPLVRQRLDGREGLAWRALDAYAARDESIAGIPGVYEFDIAGAIGFRELHYGAPADGLPLDPAVTYASIADRFPAFDQTPYDLPRLTPTFTWPLVVLSGTRDLRTPPQIARRTVETAQDGTLLTIENGHSALDTQPAAFLNATKRLTQGRLSSLMGREHSLDALPRKGFSARFPEYLATAVRLDALLG